MTVADERASSRSADNVLSIVELLSDEPAGVRMIEISRRLELPKSSTHLALKVLERRGYVERDPSGAYRLGLRLFETANRMLSRLDVRAVARPRLEELTRRTGLTSHLAALDGRHVVYIDRVDASAFVKFDTYIGKRAPLDMTAVGRALLSAMPEERLATVLPDLDAGLRAELTRFRDQGYSVENGEEVDGVYCVGAPIHPGAGLVRFSISVIGLSHELRADGFERLGAEVRDAARRISEGLGHPAPA